DSYVQVTRNYNTWSGGQSVAFVSEAGSSIADAASLTTATTMRLRLVRSASNVIVGSYSVNGGSTWVQVGSAARTFSAPRLGLIVGADEAGGAAPVATILEVKVMDGL